MTEPLGLYEAIRTTRAVRRLRSDPIPDAVLRRVLEAASFAPSGGNRQPFRIVVVRDPAAKRELQGLYQARWTPYAAAGRSSLAALPEGARNRSERTLAAGDYLAAHLHEAPALLVFCFDPRGVLITDQGLGRPSVVGGGSLYPAVQNALLACRAEGLGCVLTTLTCADEPALLRLLDLPRGSSRFRSGCPAGIRLDLRKRRGAGSAGSERRLRKRDLYRRRLRSDDRERHQSR